ncbi:MAG: retropepsin-like domain-containing protein [Saprospiraceae bacterium]|nr:retropepsin-like domain-containing protein [Saprospiraceae bacterium]
MLQRRSSIPEIREFSDKKTCWLILFSLLIQVFLAGICIAENKVPFEIIDNLIIVQAAVDGVPGNYILDTGSSLLVLNESEFQSHETLSPEKSFGIAGEPVQTKVRWVQLEWGEDKWKHVKALVLPLHQLEAKCGVKISGLIGNKIFRRHLLEIDFSVKEIVLSRHRKGTAINLSRYKSNEQSVIPFRWECQVPSIVLVIENKLLSFGIDTGSEELILDLAHLPVLDKFIHIDRAVKITGIDGNHYIGHRSTASNLFIGNLVVAEPQLLILPLKRFNRYGSCDLDGFIGSKLLQNFRVVFNFPEKTISFHKTIEEQLIVKAKDN